MVMKTACGLSWRNPKQELREDRENTSVKPVMMPPLAKYFVRLNSTGEIVSDDRNPIDTMGQQRTTRSAGHLSESARHSFKGSTSFHTPLPGFVESVRSFFSPSTAQSGIRTSEKVIKGKEAMSQHAYKESLYPPYPGKTNSTRPSLKGSRYGQWLLGDYYSWLLQPGVFPCHLFNGLQSEMYNAQAALCSQAFKTCRNQKQMSNSFENCSFDFSNSLPRAGQVLQDDSCVSFRKHCSKQIPNIVQNCSPREEPGLKSVEQPKAAKLEIREINLREDPQQRCPKVATVCQQMSGIVNGFKTTELPVKVDKLATVSLLDPIILPADSTTNCDAASKNSQILAVEVIEGDKNVWLEEQSDEDAESVNYDSDDDILKAMEMTSLCQFLPDQKQHLPCHSVQRLSDKFLCSEEKTENKHDPKEKAEYPKDKLEKLKCPIKALLFQCPEDMEKSAVQTSLEANARWQKNYSEDLPTDSKVSKVSFHCGAGVDSVHIYSNPEDNRTMMELVKELEQKRLQSQQDCFEEQILSDDETYTFEDLN